jgi:hypothetical protein
MHSGKMSYLLPVAYRSDQWLLPVKLMAPVRPVNTDGQAVACRRSTAKFQEDSVTPLGTGTKATTKEQTTKKESPSQNLARQLQTSQELDNKKTGQHHTSTTVH